MNKKYRNLLIGVLVGELLVNLILGGYVLYQTAYENGRQDEFTAIQYQLKVKDLKLGEYFGYCHSS